MKNILLFLLLWVAACVTFAQSHKELVILHTNDTHSQIEPYTSKTDTNVGGFLRREALIREVRSHHDNVLLFDAGDFSQGTPYFNFFQGYVEVKLMNAMHYDAATLGNHEFDNGLVALAKRLKKADFQVVCANYQFANKSLSKQIKPYTIIEKNGLKIGVFGLTVDVCALVAPSTATCLKYLDPIQTAHKCVEILKNQGCDLIVCLSHLGVEEEDTVNDYLLANAVPDIDIIIGGHSHKELKEPVLVGNTRIYQMAKSGKCVGQITLNY